MNAPSQFDRFERNGKEILRLRPAWRSFWRSGIVVTGIFMLWLVKKEVFDGLAHSLGIPAQLSALGLVIGLAPIVFAVLYQRYTRSYEIEDGCKLRVTVGFIARTKREFSLSDKIQADMSQTIPARLLNYGIITFWTGDDKSRLQWFNAPAPDKVIGYIDTLKDPAHYAASTPPGASDPSASKAPSSGTHTSAAQATPSLAEAKKTKATHFGPMPDHRAPSDKPRLRYKTPFGHYIDNRDGTVSHEETGLMWIRAPWGMVWNGESFTGEPIKLKWEEATRLFGRGAAVNYQVGTTKAFFDRKKRVASAFRNGYRLGKCRIDFASHQDWRLPTADDYQLMSISARPHRMGDGDHDPAVHELNDDEVLEWSWLGRANSRVIARLFPEFYTLTSRREVFLWSATELGDALAWAYDGTFPVGDYKIKNPMGVMFVRQGRKSDYVGYKIMEGLLEERKEKSPSDPVFNKEPNTKDASMDIDRASNLSKTLRRTKELGEDTSWFVPNKRP